jgi:hypothetical protein
MDCQTSIFLVNIDPGLLMLRATLTSGIVQLLEDVTREFVATEEQDVEWLLGSVTTVEMGV